MSSPAQQDRLLIAHLFLCGLALLFGALSVAGISSDTLLYLVSAGFTLSAAWYVVSWRLFCGGWGAPYLFFIVSASLFNGGQLVLEAFGQNDNGMLFNFFPTSTILHTAVLVWNALTLLHLGALLAARGYSPSAAPYVSPDRLRTVGWILLVISAGPSAYLLYESFVLVWGGGYFALYQRSLKTTENGLISAFSTFLLPAAMFLLSGARENKSARMAACAVTFTFVLVGLFLGGRSGPGFALIAFLYVWHHRVKPIRWQSWPVAAGAMFLLVFPLLFAVRDLPGASRLQGGAIAGAVGNMRNPVVALLDELGTSMAPVTFTHELVPEKRPFDLGQSYAYGALVAVPRALFEKHPTEERGYLAEWLIGEVDPYVAATGGGMGYSFIAEAFLNFGYIGVTFGMLLLGWFWSRGILWADRALSNPAGIAALGSILGALLFLPRAESASFFRPLIWSGILPYLLACWLEARAARRSEAINGYPERA